MPSLPTERRGRWDRAESALNTSLVIVLAVFSSFYVYHAVRLILYPYSIDYGEGFVLNQGKEFANGRSPYQPIDTPPWLVANYPPVYTLAVGLGVKLFGVQFHFGRVLSMLGILTAGCCLWRIVCYQTSNRFASVAAGLTWLCSYPVYNWGTHHRVDSFGIGLEALGLLFLIRRNHLKVSILFFLLALYTRQTLVMGPLAGYFFLRRVDGPRAAAKWFGTLILAGLLLFGFLSALSGGEFARHLILYNANEYNLKDVVRMWLGAVMTTSKIPSVFLLFYLARSIVTKRWDLAAVCAPFALLTFGLVGKMGSATNYLLELMFVSSWIVGLLIAEAQLAIPKENAFRPLPVFLLLFDLVFPLHIPHVFGSWGVYDWGATPIRSSPEFPSQLAENLRRVPKAVFSQDSGLALLAGKDLVWQPFIMTQLSKEGRWDIGPFHEKIRRQAYGAVVLPFDMDVKADAWAAEEWWTQFSPETAATLHRYYQVAPRLKPPLPPDWRSMDPRVLRGYPSPFWTNYLYLPRERPLP